MSNQKPDYRNQSKKKGRIFVISGPSGSGKTTLLKRLLRAQALKNRLVKSISLTTRPKRSGEKEGIDYFFINKQEFKQRHRAKKILEWTRYLGYYYATPKDFVEGQLKKDKNLILCLDLKGASQIKRIYPKNTITIFILPPSLKALRLRIERRSHKTKKGEIQKRLRLAQKELLASRRYNYCLVNKNLDNTVKRLKEIILNRASQNSFRP